MPCFGADWLGFADLPGRIPAPSLWQVLEAALAARVLAACVVQWYVDRGPVPRICVFPDAEYYWALASTIREGTLYEIVEWGDIPHFALRTPGYPLFLAACRMLLGEHPMGVRLVQAGLGAVTVWLVYGLTRAVTGEQDHRSRRVRRERRRWSVPVDRRGARERPSLLDRDVGPGSLGSGVRADHAGGALGAGGPLEEARCWRGRPSR